MSRHSYSSIYFHLVWSTKNKRPYIKSEFKKDLYSFIGKTIIMKGWHPIAINGTEDHIHILIQLFPNCKISDMVANIKASSSRFIKENFNPDFAWQGGYSIFTVDSHCLPRIKNYILKQEEHHKIQSFEDEYRLLLVRNNLEYGDYSTLKMIRKNTCKL